MQSVAFRRLIDANHHPRFGALCVPGCLAVMLQRPSAGMINGGYVAGNHIVSLCTLSSREFFEAVARATVQSMLPKQT